MSTTLALLFAAATNTFDLPPGLLQAVCFVESGYNTSAIHHNDGDGDSLGICQIKAKTATWLGYKGTQEELMGAYVNIYYAAKYLKYNINRYHGDIARALVAYNKGNARGLTSSNYSNKVLLQYWQIDTEIAVNDR